MTIYIILTGHGSLLCGERTTSRCNRKQRISAIVGLCRAQLCAVKLRHKPGQQQHGSPVLQTTADAIALDARILKLARSQSRLLQFFGADQTVSSPDTVNRPNLWSGVHSASKILVHFRPLDASSIHIRVRASSGPGLCFSLLETACLGRKSSFATGNVDDRKTINVKPIRTRMTYLRQPPSTC